jgi:hypothetical protein
MEEGHLLPTDKTGAGGGRETGIGDGTEAWRKRGFEPYVAGDSAETGEVPKTFAIFTG